MQKIIVYKLVTERCVQLNARLLSYKKRQIKNRNLKKAKWEVINHADYILIVSQENHVNSSKM